MKIVIAPDSYKESLSASEVAQAIEKDFGKFSLMHSMFPCPSPTAAKDGGSHDCRHPGKEHFAWVTGPLGESEGLLGHVRRRRHRVY